MILIKSNSMLVVVLVLLSVSACSSDIPKGATVHPQIDLFPEYSTVANLERAANESDLIDFSKDAVLKGLSEIQFVEAWEEMEQASGDFRLFGEIASVKFSSVSTIMILDEAHGDIVEFRVNGSSVQQFGGPGRGPLEFRRAVKLVVGDSSEVLVVDGGQQSQIISTDGPDGMSAKYFPKFISDVQYSGTDYVTLSEFDSDSLVMIYDANLELKNQFGSKYSSGNVIIDMSMTKATLLMTAEESLVLAFDHIPWVLNYRTDGTLLGGTSIPDYVPVPNLGYTNAEGKSVGRTQRKGITDRLVRAINTRYGILLQVGRTDSSLLKGLLNVNFSLRYYLFSPVNNSIRFLGEDLLEHDGSLMIIDDIRGDYLVTSSNHPTPKVVLFDNPWK